MTFADGDNINTYFDRVQDTTDRADSFTPRPGAYLHGTLYVHVHVCSLYMVYYV